MHAAGMLHRDLKPSNIGFAAGAAAFAAALRDQRAIRELPAHDTLVIPRAGRAVT
jgi:tRNA A-37 threonylcarbamoyl transferase component Bud32